jgi:hypothetical protein
MMGLAWRTLEQQRSASLARQPARQGICSLLLITGLAKAIIHAGDQITRSVADSRVRRQGDDR